MLPLGRAPSVLSVPVPCHPAHLTHCRHTTHNLPRGHTQEAAASPCSAVLAMSFSWALKKPRWPWGLERTLLERFRCGQRWLRHQDGVTFLFSLRNTRAFLLQAIQFFLHYFICSPVKAAAPCTAFAQSVSPKPASAMLPITGCTIYSLAAAEPTGSESKPKRDQAQAGLLLLTDTWFSATWILSVWTK